MATITKQDSGRWRAQVRRKGHSLSETFLLRRDAEIWSRRIEGEIDAGKQPSSRKVSEVKTMNDLIDLHIADMKEVGKALGRSKAFSLALIRSRLGKIYLPDVNRDKIIEFGKSRAKDGAGPVTVAIDVGYIATLFSHAAAVHGLPFSAEPISMGRRALARLGLVGKSMERDRRPTDEEVEAIIKLSQDAPRTCFPLHRIVPYGIATAMRLDEICRVEWTGLTTRNRTQLITDRKDPREKLGNDQRIPLLSASGFDAYAITMEQKAYSGNSKRIFPYNSRSVGTAFRRTCEALGIEDLHFHDLRHEGTSRLFEAGFDIPQVAMVTGHKDWKMLRRYTHLRPESLHYIAAQNQSRISKRPRLKNFSGAAPNRCPPRFVNVEPQ